MQLTEPFGRQPKLDRMKEQLLERERESVGEREKEVESEWEGVWAVTRAHNVDIVPAVQQLPQLVVCPL